MLYICRFPPFFVILLKKLLWTSKLTGWEHRQHNNLIGRDTDQVKELKVAGFPGSRPAPCSPLTFELFRNSIDHPLFSLKGGSFIYVRIKI